MARQHWWAVWATVAGGLTVAGAMAWHEGDVAVPQSPAPPHSTAQVPPAPDVSPLSLTGPQAGASANTHGQPQATRATHTTRPAWLAEAEWQELQSAFAHHPQREAEIARALSFVQFQREVAQFQQWRENAAAATAPTGLLTLARALRATLDQRMARHEVSAPEALKLQSALLDVLVPDDTERAQQLQQWRTQQLANTARAASSPSAVQDERFLRAQQALVSQWQQQQQQQQPAGAARPPEELFAQMEALRQQTYQTDSPTHNTTHNTTNPPKETRP